MTHIAEKWARALRKAGYTVKIGHGIIELRAYSKQAIAQLKREGWQRAGTGQLHTYEYPTLTISRGDIWVETVHVTNNAIADIPHYWANVAGSPFGKKTSSREIVAGVVSWEEENKS